VPGGASLRQVTRGRPRLLLVALLLAAVLLAAVPALVTRAQDERPDIFVVYLDDAAPHDGRLWNDPARTPALAALFAEQGIAFDNAISETPLCSPARATLLTGRHTANHGVNANIVGPFDPGVTIGTELRDAGYRTAWVGKYLNGLRDELTLDQLAGHAVGWDVFDVIYANNGKFFNYDLWTRDGIEHHARGAEDHSTDVIRQHVTEALRETPAGTPVLAVASVFDLHAPNRPPERFTGDPRCRDIEPWSPPNFGEDVSDKPAYVQERPPLQRDGWRMRRYCEEMLAVDELVADVVEVQRERGRLEDTLFVFTSDNGNTWGAHNLRQVKSTPYATPVHLVMTWANRWGTEPRHVAELVSNIDLAPTLCAIAGCELGPFPSGPPGADGLSLLPLLDGETEHLERTQLREQSGPGYPALPESWSIRTTSQHSLGRWHYAEYVTGERELYDSVADPWELENLAADPAHAETLARLAADLRLEFPDLPPPAVAGTTPAASSMEPTA
jgi:N-acetylglucosamine-6-sulfatase